MRVILVNINDLKVEFDMITVVLEIINTTKNTARIK